VADLLIREYGLNPDDIETASSLAATPEQRIKFQYDVQKYVDMAISSTLNLPSWGSELNNPDRVLDFASIVAKYAPGLRGLTFYPDGSRGGQPLESVPYTEAIAGGNAEYEENSACKDGVCGL
jgi:ribonucleoside-diphosphate reductase alpha chain